MKKIAVIFNGGTISMKVDPKIKAAVPSLTGEEIMHMVTGIEKHAEILSYNFSSFPSPHMTLEKIMELRAYTLDILEREKPHGVVITHGTDTLEETAYLFDLTMDTPCPIVFTGAMRSGSELGYDGPSNLAQAIVTASAESSVGRGVLVCLNSELNSASEVTKANSLSLNAFRTPVFGPLGIVDNNKVIYYRNTDRREVWPTDQLSTKVELVKTVAGMDSRVLRFLVDDGCEGIVIEALGRGNVPPMMVEGIRYALSRNLPVVIVSRCFEGRVFGSYGYEGGGKHLRNMGVIFGDSLPGQKARIKLMVALSRGKDLEAIKAFFEQERYLDDPDER
ncbi:asparaginase [Proteiniclasticum sp. BAD-10]|uniref:Asparaginase n=1 Tax=Proteiniclasticum sediminis TaxID=2804028 RepID=A0A941CP03_9CLOT|nr:asparaginase [Proteiniclasticum sediminis]MBR0575424.1 asparaginase [Proteiniclasticum sediminis]